jgi:hypothetical protein
MIQVNGKDYMLVHAGFDPSAYESIPLEQRQVGWCYNSSCSVLARNKSVEVPGGFGIQSEQTMLWERRGWIFDVADAPIETIYGHTYMRGEFVEIYNEKFPDEKMIGGEGSIAHYKNKHSIDCGCAYARSHPEAAAEGKYRLGCLRLDDMKEFYVNVD